MHVFGQILTINEDDPVSIRTTKTSHEEISVFLHEDVCGDAEEDHIAEDVGFLIIVEKDIAVTTQGMRKCFPNVLFLLHKN